MPSSKPPGPPKSTPKVYMTPHLAKRKDGLCPSLLHQEVNVKKERPGHVNKPYRTNSALLLQIKERESLPREVVELQTIVDAVKVTLKTCEAEEGITNIRFKPEGCIWKMDFEDEVASKIYKMEVVCSANSTGGATNYVIDCNLIPRVAVDPSPLATPPKGFSEAKAVFDTVALNVRKSLVRLEFPEFPEGCKGRAFREVYQLNARVSSFHLVPV